MQQATILGFTPLGFIAFCIFALVLMGLLTIIWFKWQMRKLVESRTFCVFITKDNNPMKHNLLRNFKATIKRAGIDPAGLDLHALRYTFITHLVMKGVNPKVVQELAGHKSISTTLQIYAQVLPGQSKKAIDQLPL